jgi:hypothetical protein
MNTLNVPGFTACASLYRTMGHFQPSMTRVGGHGKNEVVAQIWDKSWNQAEGIRKTLGIGVVHCHSECPSDPKQTQFCKEVCYWWPW